MLRKTKSKILLNFLLRKIKLQYRFYSFIEILSNFLCVLSINKNRSNFKILNFECEKIILILTFKVSDRSILLGRLWKNRGYKVYLIYCEDNPIFKKLENGKFDKIIKTKNSLEAVSLAERLNPEYIHYTCYSADLIGYYLIKKEIEFIFDYKDLFYNTYSSFKDIESGLLERQLIIKSAYITCRDNQIFNYININKIKLNVNKLLKVPEYYITDTEYESLYFKKISKLPNKNEKIKIVVSGGFTEDSEFNRILFEGVSKIIETLLINGVEVNVLGGFSNVNDLDQGIYVSNLQNKNNRINFVPSMESDEYDLALLQYDFALHMVNNDLFHTDYSIHFENTNHTHYSGSARILSFIKAGLPILTGKTYSYTNDFLGDSGFSVPICPSEKYNIGDILRKKITSHDVRILHNSRSRYSEDEAWKNFSHELKKMGE